MGIVNLQTDLKSLEFGRDRAGDGNSGQPYITKPIDESPQYSIADKDFLLRGGLKAPLDSLLDVKRLTKWFVDKKNPSGLLFTIKQNLLSRIAVRTQASGVGLNEGVYTPLTTLAQAGLNFGGIHIPKQGLIPIRGVTLYGPKSPNDPLSATAVEKVIGGESGEENRLVQLTNFKINNGDYLQIFKKNDIKDVDTTILSYGGGPGSILGIGRTRIRFATNNKGAPLQTGKNNIKLKKTGFFINPSETTGRFSNAIGGFDVFVGKSRENPSRKIEDFREEKFHISKQKISYVTGIAPSYKLKGGFSQTIDGPGGSRINYNSPGRKGNIKSYTKGKRDELGNPMGAVDQINAQPIYNSKFSSTSFGGLNDLINFRIGSIVPGTSTQDWIHFRAYIDSFNDAYSSTWSSTNYMGRAEPFYKYGGFNRKINLSFNIAAQSKEELLEQYRKLNFLASTLAPTYSDKGYMGGSLVTLTIGGWCYELPGFIENLTFDIPSDSPWEIGINDTDGEPDPELSQLPHVIVVSGFSFQPIERFRPQKQVGTDLSYSKTAPQQYIALTNNDGKSLY